MNESYISLYLYSQIIYSRLTFINSRFFIIRLMTEQQYLLRPFNNIISLLLPKRKHYICANFFFIQILLFDNQNCSSKYSKMIALFFMLISCFLGTVVQANLTSKSNGTQITLFPQGQLLPFNENISLFSGEDKITDLIFTECCLLTLNNNNAIQVRNRSSVKDILSIDTKYFLSQNTTSNLRLIDLLFDQQTSTLITIGKKNESLMFSRFILLQNFQLLLQSQFYLQNTSEWKNGKVINQTIYSYFTSSNVSDYIIKISFYGSILNRVDFTTRKASIYFSPNNKYAVLVSRHSIIYAYDMQSNFSLLFQYNGCITEDDDETQTVNFSPDGQNALIETNDQHSIVSLNLASGNKTIVPYRRSDINYVNYVDEIDRFIMITKNKILYFFDKASNNTYQINMEKKFEDITIDIQNNRFFYFQDDDDVKVINYNVKINGSLIIGVEQISFVIIENITHNQTVPQDSLYTVLYPSQSQNKTFQVIGSFSNFIKDTATTINVIAFSSPFACFFLSFFNYFTLNSLYILLNIRIPNLVFEQFSSLFNSININLLEYFDIHLPFSQLLDEQVNEERAIYFGITTSLVYNIYYQVIAITFNAVIIQTILKFKRKSKIIGKICSIGRKQMYLGLAVSCIIPIILPWKFVIFNNYGDIKTKINTMSSFILYYGSFFFIMSSLIYYRKSQLQGQKSKKSLKNIQAELSQWTDLPEWYIIVQNFIYPFFVMLSNPIYFLFFVLISKILQIYIQITFSNERKWFKILQIFAYSCEIIFHLTFYVFWIVSSEQILIYSSIVCMVAFWLGGFFNLIIILIIIGKGLIRLIKRFKSSNKISSEITKQQSTRFKKQTIKIDIFNENELQNSKKQVKSVDQLCRKNLKVQLVVYKQAKKQTHKKLPFSTRSIKIKSKPNLL